MSEDNEQEDVCPMSDPFDSVGAHKWHCYGEAPDGTTFWKCKLCGKDVEG